MSCDTLYDYGYVSLHCSRNKSKIKSKKINKRKLKLKSNIRVQVYYDSIFF